jgi:hypothetical protein
MKMDTPPDDSASSAPHQRAAEGDNAVIDRGSIQRHSILK